MSGPSARQTEIHSRLLAVDISLAPGAKLVALVLKEDACPEGGHLDVEEAVSDCDFGVARQSIEDSFAFEPPEIKPKAAALMGIAVDTYDRRVVGSLEAKHVSSITD